jgi:beta-1,4-N-acetylglucosaminyltransferase
LFAVPMLSKSPKGILRICLICSVGGHFKQMLKLTEAWKDHDHFFVLMDKPVIDSFRKREQVFMVTSPERNPFLFVINIFESFKIFLKMKPDIVISTGAGVAIAMCYIAKFFKKKVIYIEDWCIVEKPSVTGRAVYPIANLFIVQREHLKAFYPKAVFGGELF